MKPTLFLLGLVSLCVTGSLEAQNYIPPATSTSALPAEPGLIPEEVKSVPKPHGAALPEKRSKTDESTEALLARIHLREARIKAERDPQVAAAWAEAGRVRTENERRDALRRYYRLLYARVIKINPAIKSTAEERQKVSLKLLDQPNIDTKYGDPSAPVESVAIKRDWEY